MPEKLEFTKTTRQGVAPFSLVAAVACALTASADAGPPAKNAHPDWAVSSRIEAIGERLLAADPALVSEHGEGMTLAQWRNY